MKLLIWAFGECNAETCRSISGIDIGYGRRGLRASVHDDRRDYAKAIEDYTKAIELKPDFAGAYSGRGSSW